MVFSTKNTKNFLGTAPSPDPSLSEEGIPHPHAPTLGACMGPRALDPSHSKILGTPLKTVMPFYITTESFYHTNL